MAVWTARLQLAEEMSQHLLTTDCKELRFELRMAKAALEKELARNSSIVEAAFGMSSLPEQPKAKIVKDDQSGLCVHPPEAKTTITDSVIVNEGKGLKMMHVAKAGDCNFMSWT